MSLSSMLLVYHCV